jgi:acetolactate synthase-1/2/3 large subunit
VGQCGRDGPPFSSDITRQADVILALGTRFEEYETSVWEHGVTFSFPPTKLIQVDIDPREIGKNYPVEFGLVGDICTVLQDMLKDIEDRGCTADMRGTEKRIAQLKQDWLAKIDTDANSDAVPINPHRLMKELKTVFPENACLVVEACNVRPLSLQHYIPVDKGNFFCGQGLQLIGNSTAEALGVKVGRPNQPVIALVGDGSFLLMNQAVPTAVEYGIPVIWVVMNNFGYRAVWALQQKWFKRSIGSEFIIERTGELYSPDYAKIAEAFGAMGETVERPEKIRPALEKALAAEKPYVVDVRVDKDVGFNQLVSTKSSWEFFWPTWRRGSTANDRTSG